ncbi:hypothetical protein AVEN_129616-1 [Araneus ventricosus]|uniref:Uncharacterized protein n=1 Tax=Araneus ventricosus TaxID=182803 RepID=A0A4Y2J688_ARAVE|nr:hypothetical protein AVEN_129616-1 [Araneus ventricosus]
MRDDFEGVNFLDGKRTWKYIRRESWVRKKRGMKREKRKKARRKKSYLATRSPCWNDWKSLPMTRERIDKSLQDGQQVTGIMEPFTLTSAGPRR